MTTHINMMPFILGNHDDLPLGGLIDRCSGQLQEAIGEVCYLTVRYWSVGVGGVQSRPGRHTERRNAREDGTWGKSGVFLMTNVPNTLRIWDYEVPLDEIGPEGDASHISPSVTRSFFAEPGVIYRVTDQTMHEALPQKVAAKRLFFRLVGPDVGAWWAKHSTRNPDGTTPGSQTQILHHSKF